MATYRYEAIGFAGETVQAEMAADSRDAVVEHLHRTGLMPLSVEEASARAPFRLDFQHLFRRDALSLRDLAFLTQELATMLQSGIPMDRALDMLESISHKPATVKFLQALSTQIRMGASLSDALARQPGGTLPRIYLGMVRAGEAGGVLEATLERLALYLAKAQELRAAIGAALTYPAILVVVALFSIGIVLTVVLPQFEPLFQTGAAGAALPFSTRALLAVSHGVRDWGWLLLLALVLAALVADRALRREDVARRRDAFLLRLPLLGTLISALETARFCRTLGTLQANGIPMAAALPIAGESFGNRVFAAKVAPVASRVREGESLSAAWRREAAFPPLALQLMRVGEETGHLDAMLLKVADILDRDVKRSLDRLLALLTPALTVIMGVAIGGIISAVLSAVLGVNDLAH